MKSIILTGFSRGLGKSLWQRLLDLGGVRLFAVGRAEPETMPYANCSFMHWDLTKSEEVPSVREIVTGGDCLTFINNAGTVAPIGDIGELHEEDLRQAAQINFVSPMLFCNRLVGACREKRQNLKIINISTGAANYPIAGWSAYCSTKVAFKMFLDVLAEQEKDGGYVEVVHVDPGVMDTEMQEKIRAADAKSFPRLAEFQALKAEGKLRRPEDVAESIIRKYII
ncbi:SDR family NAD(P)-dependent oxidoreductase [uncultured Selenomonas sp.]|uniref:SDR family NAD(P)-dependent oxidoreductase n=1 Tax=uncultured Selenomonas sp. TaxID=159275 RepID=UPI0028EF530E|nr:SDR family NAD(P)-dependent oxidoreductase [uncultured Selenomonas sp.]